MPRIRVLVVDDSIVACKIVADALAGDPEIEVIGTAANGRIALTMVAQLAPDLVTMDLEMPLMDGIETVRALRRRGDRLPVIMFTAVSAQDAKATFKALAAGATDFVTKPSSMISADPSLEEVAKQLVPRVRALVPHPGVRPAVPGAAKAAPPVGLSADAIRPAAPHPRTVRPVRAVVMGASIGGPEALSRVLRGTPRLPVPIVLVQHMPPIFTRQFAARLDSLCASTVLESAGGEELEPGHVYVAPGDFHLELRATARGAQTVLHQGPLVNFSRPSVDVLFHSASRVFGGDLLAVVLTGMGNDGCAGSEAVAASGGTVMVQDEASSVVWGMPGAVARAGFAHRVVPLDEVGAAIFAAVQPARPAAGLYLTTRSEPTHG
ncbi:MAG: chemotaxis response regulator protein-glutamate methylesterase [Phycicoccus sp.]|nr:chemotaxis response regulator protein-glutamate methylesterase [Phycicoccus sp.]NMM35687.1 chemotaxis response regulator protein-glutamate methylesterase [Phycicoccus sp.]